MVMAIKEWCVNGGLIALASVVAALSAFGLFRWTIRQGISKWSRMKAKVAICLLFSVALLCGYANHDADVPAETQQRIREFGKGLWCQENRGGNAYLAYRNLMTEILSITNRSVRLKAVEMTAQHLLSLPHDEKMPAKCRCQCIQDIMHLIWLGVDTIYGMDSLILDSGGTRLQAVEVFIKSLEWEAQQLKILEAQKDQLRQSTYERKKRLHQRNLKTLERNRFFILTSHCPPDELEAVKKRIEAYLGHSILTAEEHRQKEKERWRQMNISEKSYSDDPAKIRRDIPTLTTMLRTQKPGQPDTRRLCTSLVNRILTIDDRSQRVELLSDLQDAIFAIRLEGVPRLSQYACLKTVLDMNSSFNDILTAMRMLRLPNSSRYRFMIRNLEWYQAQLSEFAKGAEADTPLTQEEINYGFDPKESYESCLSDLRAGKRNLAMDFQSHSQSLMFTEEDKREIRTMIESYLGREIMSDRECLSEELRELKERQKKERQKEEESRRENRPQKPPQKSDLTPKTPTPEERMQTFQIDVDL